MTLEHTYSKTYRTVVVIAIYSVGGALRDIRVYIHKTSGQTESCTFTDNLKDLRCLPKGVSMEWSSQTCFYGHSYRLMGMHKSHVEFHWSIWSSPLNPKASLCTSQIWMRQRKTNCSALVCRWRYHVQPVPETPFATLSMCLQLSKHQGGFCANTSVICFTSNTVQPRYSKHRYNNVKLCFTIDMSV